MSRVALIGRLHFTSPFNIQAKILAAKAAKFISIETAQYPILSVVTGEAIFWHACQSYAAP